MTFFFIIAALLVASALAAVLPSALKGSPRAELDQLETNIQIAKDRRIKLKNALATGTIDQTTYDTELDDLEHGLAHDLGAGQKQRLSSRGGLAITACIALFIPIASGALYLHLGTPDGIDSQAMHEQAVAARDQQTDKPPAIDEAIASLEKKLVEDPGNLDNWKLLGNTYLLTNDFSNAKRALESANELDDGKDPDVLAGLANASAMVDGGDLSGQPAEYIDQALAIDPNHVQSLWLKAIATQQAGQHEQAITRFETLRAGVIDNPDATANIDELIAVSRQALGISEESTTATPTSTDSPTTDAPSVQGASLSVTVSLANGVIDKVNASDSVFIFARASSGPPMPLAVSRHIVSDLPVTVVLDDTMAMMPAMTLSQFPSVTVGARVSKSGDAIAQPGDWFTEKTNVLPAETSELALTIDTQK